MALMNLTGAINKAKDEFAKSDAQIMALRSKTDFDMNEQMFTVPFLGKLYNVKFPEGLVVALDSTENVPLEVQVIILHYLTHASGYPLQNKYISFKELPDGFIYIGPFTNRAIRPMVSIFGADYGKFTLASQKLGGVKADLGDISFTIPAFPLLPVTCVLWEGDEEFPASGNILFDASAGSHLATEDFAFLASMVVFGLKKAGSE